MLGAVLFLVAPEPCIPPVKTRAPSGCSASAVTPGVAVEWRLVVELSCW